MFTIFGVPAQLFYGQLMLGLVNGAFYALLSLGLAVIFGMLGIINFAHGALYMMGAFVAYILLETFHIGYWSALLLAPLAVAAWQRVCRGGCQHRPNDVLIRRANRPTCVVLCHWREAPQHHLQ